MHPTHLTVIGSLMIVLSMTGWSSRAEAQAKCTTVADCAQVAVESAQAAQTAMDRAVPKGAVMAFNLQDCPGGWHLFKPLAGRVIVGAGSGNLDMSRKDLTPRKFGDLGGEEMHTLSLAEMPAHDHGIGGTYTGARATQAMNPGGTNSGSFDLRTVQSQGENKAHNIMPPFAVLTYCERD